MGVCDGYRLDFVFSACVGSKGIDRLTWGHYGVNRVYRTFMSVNAGGPEEYLSLFLGRTLQVSMLLLLPQVQPLALHMRKLAGRSRTIDISSSDSLSTDFCQRYQLQLCHQCVGSGQ